MRRYVRSYTAKLRDSRGRRVATLLWGDPVRVLDDTGTSALVKARGRRGFLDPRDLGDQGLLEFYVIDVGQGDSVLVRTPEGEGRWHLIDAGVPGREQMTGKGAANFLRWKFLEDLGADRVSLATVVVTHPDRDHYGGLLDVLSGRLSDGRVFAVEVETLYHSGLGCYADEPRLGAAEEGEAEPFPVGGQGARRRGAFVTELLDGAEGFASPARPFAAGFAEVAGLVGSVPRRVRRLSHRDGYLPGYAPGEGPVAIRVLGPIAERFGEGREGLRVFEKGAPGPTRNGHSVVLRFDCGAARVLLTGDLNARAQRLLLSVHPEAELAVDVAKGCHHGSEDVELGFLKALQARATVLSSGDNEDYSHPRPLATGGSARYGRESLGPRGEVLPPLVYSMELARSVNLAYAARAKVKADGGWHEAAAREAWVMPRRAGARFLPLGWAPLATDLVYGLVNVRTDGSHILCATMREGGNDFDVKVFRAGVSP